MIRIEDWYSKTAENILKSLTHDQDLHVSDSLIPNPPKFFQDQD